MNKTIVLSIISLMFLSTFVLAAQQLSVSDVGANVNVNAVAAAAGAQVSNIGTNIFVTTSFGT